MSKVTAVCPVASGAWLVLELIVAYYSASSSSAWNTNASVRFTASCLKTKCVPLNSNKRESCFFDLLTPCSPVVSTLPLLLPPPHPVWSRCSTARFHLSLATPISGPPPKMWIPPPRQLVPLFLISANLLCVICQPFPRFPGAEFRSSLWTQSEEYAS